MLGNELDDTSPPRCLVHSSTVVDSVPTVTVSRILRLPTVGHSIRPRDTDIALVNNLRDRGLLMVLFGFEDDPVSAEEVLAHIQSFSHPFNTWLLFPTVQSVTHYMAMQPDVRYIIDRLRPSATYGSRSLLI